MEGDGVSYHFVKEGVTKTLSIYDFHEGDMWCTVSFSF